MHEERLISHPRLNITKSEQDGALVVQIEGEIDLSTASQFEKELLDSMGQGANLVVDLAGVDFMDSTGIGVLVRTSKKVTANGGIMGLLSAKGSVRRVIEVSGLDGVIPLYDDLAAAVQRE